MGLKSLAKSLMESGAVDVSGIKFATEEEKKKKAEEYWKKINSETENPEAIKYSAEAIYNEVKKSLILECKNIGVDFYTQDETYNELLKTLSLYFANDERFLNSSLVENKPSLKKGIMIYGSYGFGKTSMLDAFRKLSLKNNSFSYNNCYKVKELLENKDRKDADIKMLYKSPLFLDELGKETKSFGNELMVDVIGQREELFRNTGKKTHLTTNLKPESIGIRYGGHIESRLKMMFNIIKVSGIDKREL